jgi:glycosyltransferase involved in cell wall biosynthesis
MHIALTVNFSPWSRYRGGGQRSTHFLACALARRGHRVSVVFTKPPWERVAVPDDLPYRVLWAALPDVVSRRAAPLRVLTALTVAQRLRELAERDPPAVVHAQGEEGLLVPTVLRCPFLLTPRYPNYPAELLAGRSSRLGRWLKHPKYAALGATARRAVFVCPTSSSSARMLEQAFGIEPARIRILPNGVDPTFLSQARKPGAEQGPLLFFGRIEREKGIDTLVEALERSQHRERRLTIVGAGEALAWLERTLAERGLARRVELCGWEPADKLTARLSGAALAVLPSREESFGNAMIEAMAAGTPLVTTSAGSLPEVVAEGTGVLVPPGDAAALARAIDDLLAHPARAEALGRAGRAHVQSRFSWDAAAACAESLYVEALGERESAR